MLIVTLYTDGACKGNPGPGGWGVLLQYNGHEKTMYGAEPHTTNNRMELTAAIQGLAALKRSCIVKIYTDSQYVKNGITQWLPGWKRRHWRNASNEPVKNQDLWQQLDEIIQHHEIEWFWVKGHSGHPENDRVDALANQAIIEMNNHDATNCS
jgi:ribonuclease HI